MKKLKILATGNTAMAIDSNKRMNVYLSNLNLGIEGLRRLGHDVDHRPVRIGEDFAEYDRVIVYLIPITSFVATYVYGSLWALSQRPDAIIGVTDLEVRDLCNSFKVVARDEERLWRRITQGKGFRAIGADTKILTEHRKRGHYKQEIARLIQECASGHLPFPVVAPIFAWGDVNKLLVDCADLRCYDPSKLVDMKWIREGRNVASPRTRKKQWVFGGLIKSPKTLERLGLADPEDEDADGWPVQMFGPGTPNGFVTEDKLMDAYAESWGVTGRTYSARGCGWWRIRWIEAYGLKNVVAMDEREAAALDPKGKIEWRAPEIEKMTRHELIDLSEEWTRHLRSKFLTTDETLAQVHDVFTRRL